MTDIVCTNILSTTSFFPRFSFTLSRRETVVRKPLLVGFFFVYLHTFQFTRRVRVCVCTYSTRVSYPRPLFLPVCQRQPGPRGDVVHEPQAGADRGGNSEKNRAAPGRPSAARNGRSLLFVVTGLTWPG